jgi:hypothetical protein
MNVSADQVRAATRNAAAVITPDELPPLRLHEPASRRWAAGRQRAAGRPRLAWFSPLAAAAAVAVLVIGGTAAGSWFARSGNHQSTVSGASGQQASAALLGKVPAYYVALGNPSLAVVRATATGATLVRITTRIPFVGVTGAADDRTFVLDAQRQVMGPTVRWPQQPAFYLLRLTASGTEQSYTRLAVSALPIGAAVTGLALSPDGRKLAIELGLGSVAHPGRLEISIYTLATGAIRTWSMTDSFDPEDPDGFTGSGVDGAQSISWTADSRTLAFDWAKSQADMGVRLLDTTTSGGSLTADSRLAVLLGPAGIGDAPDRVSQCETDDIITPDGSAVICGYASSIEGSSPATTEVTTGFVRYSARTGKVDGVSGVFRRPQSRAGGGISLFWTNSDGSVVIGAGVTGIGVFSGEKFTPLPEITGLNIAAW